VSRRAPDAEVGDRIQVMGNSGSGKSTLAARLAEGLQAPFVELDALNWLPGWVGLNQTDPDRFERRIREATRGERWVAAGSYERFSRRILWPRLDTVVWLDLPLRLLVWRFLHRSWRRSRSPRDCMWRRVWTTGWLALSWSRSLPMRSAWGPVLRSPALLPGKTLERYGANCRRWMSMYQTCLRLSGS